jgi:hypothetical protein
VFPCADIRLTITSVHTIARSEGAGGKTLGVCFKMSHATYFAHTCSFSTKQLASVSVDEQHFAGAHSSAHSARSSCCEIFIYRVGVQQKLLALIYSTVQKCYVNNFSYVFNLTSLFTSEQTTVSVADGSGTTVLVGGVVVGVPPVPP